MVKVLIIDDSSLVRHILENGLNEDPNIRVVASAADVYQGRDFIQKYQPDVITLDVEMPKMDGIAFLKRLLPQHPIPVIMVSSLTERGGSLALEALSHGAVDIVLKPSKHLGQGLIEMLSELKQKIIAASSIDLSHLFDPAFQLEKVRPKNETFLTTTTDKIIGIGASTGGTVAIRKLLLEFPANIPGTVIVQHMPAGFTKLFADKLNQEVRPMVQEAKDGDRVIQGVILIAPGGKQCRVVREGGVYRTRIGEEDKVNGHCPSVDVLFDSLALCGGPNSMGVILTGMGKDGAKGLFNMKNNGAYTLAQDEKSSVVYGMPKEAVEIGAVAKVCSLDKMTSSILSSLKTREARV